MRYNSCSNPVDNTFHTPCCGGHTTWREFEKFKTIRSETKQYQVQSPGLRRRSSTPLEGGPHEILGGQVVLPVSLIWWCKRKLKDAKTLTKEFFDIIKMTISFIRNYDKLKEIRAQIEYLFKTAKKIFGMRNLHLYFNDAAYWRVYIHLYLASLFLQYLDIQGLNTYRAIELFQQKGGLV